MVFWRCIFRSVLESDIIIGHVVTRVGVAIPVNEPHILSKFGQHVLSRKKVTETYYFLFSTRALIHLSKAKAALRHARITPTLLLGALLLTMQHKNLIGI